MRAFLTGDDIFAQILLLRSVESKAYVLTEGPTDCALLDPHLNELSCATIAGNGKRSVLRALRIANDAGLINVCGVVDQDLETALQGKVIAPGLFHTDLYDMEAVAILEPAILSRVLSAFCDRDKLQSFEGRMKRSVRDAMVEVAFVVSYVRYVSVRDSLGLNLRGFPIGKCLGLDLKVDPSLFASLCLARSKKPSISESELVSILQTATVPYGLSIEGLCCGHDLVTALRAIGDCHLGITVSADHLHRVLRAALDCATFGSTGIAADVMAWGRQRSIVVWDCPEIIAS